MLIAVLLIVVIAAGFIGWFGAALLDRYGQNETINVVIKKNDDDEMP